MKQPYIHFYTGDWLKDPKLSLCQPASRGVWMDLLCAMHELDRSGELRGTSDELARLARCSTVELVQALTDLQNKRAADVIYRNDHWVVANRRMKKEAFTREKRAQAGSRGGSKTQANRQPTPYDNDNDNDSDELALKRVREFARGRGIPDTDAEWFFWKCVGNGWTNRGDPIRDWKATLDSWFRAGYVPSRRNGQGGNRSYLPECLKMPNPRDWQEAKRIVRHLRSKKSEHPAYHKQIDDRIEALISQFKLEL